MEAVHEDNNRDTPVTSHSERQRVALYVKQVPRDDDIVCVEDVDICLDIPSKLIQLDYPKAEDGHDEDVAKVIRKKFSKLGLKENTQDVLTILSLNDQPQSGLYMSWQARFEEAVEEEKDDTFWKDVCFIVLLLLCIILLLLHFVVV